MRPIVASMLIALLILSSCSGALFSQRPNSNSYVRPESAKFYTGTHGVDIFYEQVPTTLFYYGNTPDPTANEFPVTLVADNNGASFVRGAVFISGYDPKLIQFDEIPITGSLASACTLSFSNFAATGFNFGVRCGDSFTWTGNENNIFQRVSAAGKTWFSDGPWSKVNFNMFNYGHGSRVDIGWGDGLLSYDDRGHGLLLIALLGGLDFTKFLGREYYLEPDSYEYPGGGVQYFEYTGHIRNWPAGADQIDQHFLATNCYMYTTFAAPMVCIDPSPYSTGRKVCSPSTTSWSSGNGAPVTITRVVQENTPRTAAFQITVRNTGGGTVYNPGSLEKCSPYYPGGARSSDLDTIWIGDVFIGDQRLHCTPEHQLRLQNGEAQFTCIYQIEYGQIASAYQTPLVIELWYGYSMTIDHHVVVKRVQ